MTPRARSRALVQRERFDDRALEAWRHLNGALATFGVQEDWPILVWNYESAGLDHLIVNSHGYSGLWQNAPKGPKIYVDQPGKQDPATQIRDCEAFWLDMVRGFKIATFGSIGAFYCLNLAPAKVKSRVVYAGPGPYMDEQGNPADDALVGECAREYKARSKAYAAQDSSLDPLGKGWLASKDFGPVVTLARTPRVDAELARLRGQPEPAPPPYHSAKDIQARLGLVADGVWGPKSKAALQAFQRANGLVADGIVGPKTLLVLFQ